MRISHSIVAASLTAIAALLAFEQPAAAQPAGDPVPVAPQVPRDQNWGTVSDVALTIGVLSPFLAGLESGRSWSDEMGDRSGQNGHRSGENGHRSDAGRVEVGPKSALVGSIERARNGIKQAAIVSSHLNGVKTASAEPAAKARRS